MMVRSVLLLLLLFSTNSSGQVSPYLNGESEENDYIDDSVPWQEDEMDFPAYPKGENLLVLDIQEQN